MTNITLVGPWRLRKTSAGLPALVSEPNGSIEGWGVSARLRRKPRLVQDINTFLRFKSLPLFCNKDRFCIIALGAALAGDYNGGLGQRRCRPGASWRRLSAVARGLLVRVAASFPQAIHRLNGAAEASRLGAMVADGLICVARRTAG